MIKLPEYSNKNAIGTTFFKLAFIVCVVASLCMATFQFVFFISAGPLWRDEVSALNVAHSPSFIALWHNLQYDSAPLLWFLLQRIGIALNFEGSDKAIRLLGLLIALGIIVLLWIQAYRIHKGIPWFTIVILGCNPMFAFTAASYRSYGFALLELLATYIAIFYFFQEKEGTGNNRKSFVVALFISILCVQTNYVNLVFVACFAVSASCIAFMAGRKRNARALLGIVIIATATLLPYIFVIRQFDQWKMAVIPAYERPLSDFANRLCISPGIPFLSIIFILGTVLSIGYGSWLLRKHFQSLTHTTNGETALFGSLTIIFCIVGMFAYTAFINYEYYPWQYVGFTAVIAVSVEAALAPILRRRAGAVIQSAIILIVYFSLTGLLLKQSEIRQTNIDLLAKIVAQHASPSDLILITPWYYDISFNRYYRGITKWDTLPLGASRICSNYRPMIVAEGMPDSIAPILNRIRSTLRAGHNVWLIGNPMLPIRGGIDAIPPAPGTLFKWFSSPYDVNWSIQASTEAQFFASSTRYGYPKTSRHIREYEHASILLMKGSKK